MDQTTIDRALLGDAEAARECTEAGVAIPCPFCWCELFAGKDVRHRIVMRHPYKSDCPLSEASWIDNVGFRDRWNRRADLRALGKEAPVFADGECPECGEMCSNGGDGPLKCKCGWVDDHGIDEAFLERLRKKSPWIPVGERVPEHTGHVLILSRDPYGKHQVNISAYTHIGVGGLRLPARVWAEPYECFSQHDTVTHWMPLPAPPIDGGDA